MNVEQLNLHHLRYFRAVAHEGNLTRAARRLRVAQSALSAQVGLLEAELGVALFRREGRGLVLTEAGRLVLAYADDIHERATELVATVGGGRPGSGGLRVGAVATLSRNFQESFLRPLWEPGVRVGPVHLESGGFEGLLARLAAHELDVVLANRAPAAGPEAWHTYALARQPVSVVGPPAAPLLRFPEDVESVRWLLPSPQSEIRREFDALAGRLGVHPRVLAEVDDMATLRVLTRSTGALAVVPSVVVRDELAAGLLREHLTLPGLFERFYAVTVPRRFPHPILAGLLARDAAALLAAAEPAAGASVAAAGDSSG
jgi:LysR family transcriptional activator of nhaA